MYLFVVALVALLASIKTANAGIAGTGSVDLTQNGMNDAGLGFSFSDGSSKQKGQELVSTKLHSCKQGALDALYFYVYDCEVPSDFIKDLSENVDGFLFTSDKSLTMKSNITQSSLLLANYWNMELSYDNEQDSQSDLLKISPDDGCFVQKANTNSFSVGCGDVTCTGCNLKDFFTDFHFSSAKFLTDSTMSLPPVDVKAKGNGDDNCLDRGESCFKGVQCCSGRCSSWNSIVWTCA